MMTMIDLRCGDALAVLRRMRSRTVHCCVTSPPYFGLRDYGVDGQIGLESTPEAYVAKMVAVFREVRRVLRDDGTCWLNLGDSYATTTKGDGGHNPKQDSNHGSWIPDRKWSIAPGLKPKDLIGIPWRVAFALQADGWYLRSDIIWHKPNPMPESVRDRPTKAHEYLFLLSKSERYYYDAGAIAERSIDPESHRGRGRRFSDAFTQSDPQGKAATRTGFAKLTGRVFSTRNRRSVWTVTPKPFKGAHFATFPPKLIEPCILAGSPVGGRVLDPFNGAGTTGLVAVQCGRRYVGIDINPEYLAMSRERIKAAMKPIEAVA
jgi:DNA modification methylase